MIADLKPYSDYKGSGLPWLGQVPGHWEVKRLKNWVAINEVTLPESTPSDFEFEYVDIGSVGTGRLSKTLSRLRFSASPSRARRVIRSGDTIVSTVRTYLKAVHTVGTIYKPFIASTGFAVLTPRGDTTPRCLGYVAQSQFFTDQVTAESIGIAYPAISETKLANIPVTLPPPDEQAAIVRFLDWANGRLERAIRAKRKVIALLGEQKQAIIHRAVTRGLDPSVPLKPSGIPWLGDIPQHWEVRRLKAIAHIRYGLGQPPRESETGLPLIRATNVDQGRILEKNMVRVDPADVPKTRNAFLKAGEIIVVRSGALTADSAIIPEEFEGAVAGYDMVVTVRRARADFIAMALLSSYVQSDQLVIASMRAAQPHLNAEELGTASLLLPPDEEQKQIVEFVRNENLPIDTAITRLEREIELLREYRTRLVADVVTGKLDVREAAARLPDEAPLDTVADDADPSLDPEAADEEAIVE